MKTFTYAVVGVISAFLMGCGAVSNAVDCNQICNKYQSCFDKSYDTSGCQTKCRDNANSDTSYMSKASACSDCMNSSSCAGAAFNCPSCVGIVP